jgi:hypothetical protein
LLLEAARQTALAKALATNKVLESLSLEWNRALATAA